MLKFGDVVVDRSKGVVWDCDCFLIFGLVFGSGKLNVEGFGDRDWEWVGESLVGEDGYLDDCFVFFLIGCWCIFGWLDWSWVISNVSICSGF